MLCTIILNKDAQIKKKQSLPGFIVMKIPQDHSNLISRPSNTKRWAPAAREERMERICWATTESTSMLIRLNSSKQPHAPVCTTVTTNTKCWNVNHWILLDRSNCVISEGNISIYPVTLDNVGPRLATWYVRKVSTSLTFSCMTCVWVCGAAHTVQLGQYTVQWPVSGQGLRVYW